MGDQRTYISAWEMKTINLLSPDGKTNAVIDNPTEYGMGSPTLGRLKLSIGMSLDYCSPSIVWSDDSQYLAVPQLTERQYQQLLVIDIPKRKIGYVEKEYKVIELYTFSDSIIRGIDSPFTIAMPIIVYTNEICWD